MMKVLAITTFLFDAADTSGSGTLEVSYICTLNHIIVSQFHDFTLILFRLTN